MLRTKNVAPGRQTKRPLSYACSSLLVAVAVATTLVRGESTEEPTNAETKQSPTATELAADAHNNAENADASGPVADLFSRPAFDPTMLRAGSTGGFLVRVAELLRHPEMQPHVDAINQGLASFLHDFLGPVAEKVDLRTIDWIAGDFRLTVRPATTAEHNGQIMFGTGGLIIRTSQPDDWETSVLQAIPGASRKTFAGQSYVELPSLPSLGPMPVRMRAPNDRTIIYGIATKADDAHPEAEASFMKKFFDDAPRPCAWASVWRAVDGGLVTVVVDNSAAGWQDLAQERKANAFPASLLPLFDKTRFMAFGCDWTAHSRRTGLRVRVTCDDQASVRDIHLATLTALSYWPAMFVEGGETVAQFHKRILQFFSSVSVQPSAADSENHYIHASAEVAWEPGEFVTVLGQLCGWLVELPPPPETPK